MNIEDLDEDLEKFIKKYFPNLNWEGTNTSASADLTLDTEGCIDYNLMHDIRKGMKRTKRKEFTLTIRPSENKLIIYYID
jgi:hypothetical protein